MYCICEVSNIWSEKKKILNVLWILIDSLVESTLQIENILFMPVCTHLQIVYIQYTSVKFIPITIVIIKTFRDVSIRYQIYRI